MLAKTTQFGRSTRLSQSWTWSAWASSGRSPQIPGDRVTTRPLKIYICGYLNRVPSSRRLEREAQRGGLAPDFKTIADFRRDNGTAIQRVCREFVELIRQFGLFGDGTVAIDGSKFKAVNNRDKNFTPHKLKARVQQLEDGIARYLNDLDRADRQPGSVPAGRVADLKEDRRSKGTCSHAAWSRETRRTSARSAGVTHRSRCSVHGHQWTWHRCRRL